MINKLKGKFLEFVKDKTREKETRQEEQKNIQTTETEIKAKVIKETNKKNSVVLEPKDLSYKFPLEQGDIIELRSNKKYKVCKRTITGAISNTIVTLNWINKPDIIQQKDRVEQVQFSSIREMNYYIQKESSSIINIEKCYKNKIEKKLTIEECHVLALQENEKRKKVAEFFTNLQEKKQIKNAP